MKKLLLALCVLSISMQTHCSVQNTENISLIAQSCSSEHFNIPHKNRIPAQHGIPTLHEIAFKKLKPTVKNAIADLINHKYDDEHDKQNKFNFIEAIAAHCPHVLGRYINAPIDIYNNILLHSASKANNPEMTQYLLNAGANVNQQNDTHWTPLHLAAHNNAHKAIPLLIGAGADITILNLFQQTPRMCTNNPVKLSILDRTILNQHYEIPIRWTHEPATLTIFDQAVAARQLKQKEAAATKIQALG